MAHDSRMAGLLAGAPGPPPPTHSAAPSLLGLLTVFSGGRVAVGFLIMEPFCYFPSFVFLLRMVDGALSAGGFHTKTLAPCR